MFFLISPHLAHARAEVTYDDESVRKMLDRSQEGEKTAEKSFGLNEYLRSFKVATYKVKDIDEKEVSRAAVRLASGPIRFQF